MNAFSIRPLRDALALLTSVALFSAIALTPIAHAAPKKAPPAKPASQYPANETHPAEHVTIAIDPCDNQKDCDFFRLPYVAHSLLPVRVIITNDGDTALSLEDARMQILTPHLDRLPAADLEEMNRRMFTFRSTRPTKIPLIPITINHPPIDKKITDDDLDFGFLGTVVNAHTTVAGYLFYDIKDLEDPPLKGAEFYIKMIHTLNARAELFAFTIPFDKWLATRSPPTKP